MPQQKRSQKRSISKRIRAVILFVSLIVLVLTASAFVLYDVSTYKRELLDKLESIAAVIADNSTAPLVFENPSNAEDVLDAIRGETDVVAAIVYDAEGTLFASFPTPLPQDILPATLQLGSRISENAATVVLPITQENKRIGTLYLRSSLRGLHARLSRYALISTAVFVFSLVGAFILSTVLQKRISDPILALTKTAHEITHSHDLSVRAPRMTDDELGTLADSFNLMLERTQQQHARLAEQARLLDLSNDAIIVRDLLGQITYWNRGAEEIYGWSQAEALGKTKEELLHTQFPIPRTEIYDQFYRDGRWQGELIQTRRDGKRIYVMTRWALDRDSQNRSGSTLITDNDITDRKKAEESLRENERRFRTLGDNIAHLAWMTAPDGYVFWYNQRWIDYTGLSLEDMKGRGWEKVFHPDHLDRVRAKWLQHLESGESWEDTFPILGKDGQYRWFLSRAFPIKNAQGEIISWFGTNTDITEQKLSEEELERLVSERTAKLQETIGELEAFSYSISHDMRAPLRAMQGYSRALLQDYSPQLDQTAQRYLERIQRGANRLDLLIQDVLAYSKVSKGDIALHPVDLEKLIDDLILAHPDLQEPRALIHIDRPLPTVMGHEAYLTQCITNLLGNAVKFVPEGKTPQVRVRAEVSDNDLRLWFEDNGIGIDPAHFKRIFEIFGQVHPEKQFGGTGIGLAIVRKAAQRMNGEVGVESQVGHGSRFWLQLKKG